VIGLLLHDAFWSALAATGFGVLFNVPRRTLLGCALTGASGHAVRTLMMETTFMSIEAATLIGATVVGFLGMILARRLRTPTAVFTVTGAIPMVPGLYAYSAILGLIRLTESTTASEGLLVEAVVNLFRTLMILGAIALGISMPRLLFRRQKPVV
jgi:uncharacterized membrane protein YjjB (DUF3815 family)